MYKVNTQLYGPLNICYRSHCYFLQITLFVKNPCFPKRVWLQPAFFRLSQNYGSAKGVGEINPPTALKLKNILLSVHPFTFANFLIKFM